MVDFYIVERELNQKYWININTFLFGHHVLFFFSLQSDGEHVK